MNFVDIGNLVVDIMSALFQQETGMQEGSVDFDKSFYTVPASETNLGTNAP